MPKMFSANPRVSRTDKSTISSSSNNKMITKSTRLSQIARSSRYSVNRTLASVFGPTDIFLSSYTLFVNVPVGTEVARISSKDVNSFTFIYTVDDNSLFYVEGDKLYTNTVFTDRVNFDGHSVRITTNDGTYKFSKTIFIPFQRPPVVSNIVNPLIINFGTNQSTINLSNTFFDVNGDTLTITAVTDNPGLVSTNVNGYILTTTYSQNSGSSVITLKAYDTYNEFAVTTFSIVILPNNIDYNVTINELPTSLPEPVDIIIDGQLTSYTQLDSTHINIIIDDPDKATEEEKRDNVKTNISSIINKYITTSTDDTSVELYIPIDVLPFPQLASNIDKVRIIDSSTSTADNPLSVNLTDNIENSATYVNTTPGNKVIVNLLSDTLIIEQVTKDIFNVSINDGEVVTKNAGDFVVLPTSETVILLSSIIISENHAPIAYDVNYTVSEDSIQNIVELNGYDMDINETSKNYIQYVIKTSPQYGVLDVSLNNDFRNKQIKYTPSENYFGSDTFSYYVKDNYGVVSNTANVGITVTNVDDPATGALTMTGTVEEGGLVTYSSTITDIDGDITFTYQWQLSDNDNDWNNINGATEASYSIPSDQSLVDKYIRVTATTTDSRGGKTNFNSQSSKVINVDDPATGTLTMTGIVEEGGNLTYSSTINDVDGTITFTYQWQVSDDDNTWSNINGATEASYTIPSDQSLVDKYIRITAITTDSRGGTTNFISQSSKVINVDDPAIGTLTMTGTVEEGGTLSANTTSISDVDGTITFTYQWQVSDNNSIWTNINGATSSSFIIPSDQSLVDKYIRVTAVSTDSRGGITNFVSVSSQINNVDDPATGTLTMIGTVEEGGTVTYSSTINDVDGTITFTYQWQVSDNDNVWTNINGATEASYTIPSDQSLVDKYIRITAVTTDSRGGTTNFESQSSKVINVDDPATGTVTITGTVAEGNTISANTSSISDVDGTITFTYQWQFSDNNTTWTNIDGAIQASYSIPSDQSFVDKYIRITAITTDSRGGTTNFISQSSKVINVDDPAIGTLTMTGTVEEGGTLSANTTSISDVDGTITFTYQWQVSDNDTTWTNINGAIEASYIIPSDQSLVDKYIRVTAITTDSRGGITNFVSVSSQISNVDDSATGILTITGTVEEGKTISANTTSISDVDGTITFTYQWQISNNNTTWTNITNATEASYTIPSDQSLVDKYVRVTAIATDNRGGITNFVSVSSQVSNVDDPATGTLTITGTVAEGGTISANTTSISDVDGTITFTYQWQISDNNSSWTNINGATEASYTIPSDQSLVDKYIRVTAITTDSRGGITNFESQSSQVINVDDPATGTLTMTGTVEEGGNVTYSSTINDVDGTITFTYQWQVSNDNSSWTDINGATEASYTIPSDQSLVDKYIRVTAVSTDSRGGTTNFISQSSKVINVDDPATGTLTMIGTVEEGGTVTYSSTINDVDGTITFTYQWQVSDNNSSWTNITGATGESYTIPSDQSLVDKYIRVTAVTTDSRGGITNFVSVSSQVSSVDDPATGTLTITGSVSEGNTISANTTSISDVDGLITFTYKWQISDNNSTWTDINGATSSSYTIPSDQSLVDKYIRVAAVSTDSRGGTTNFVSVSSQVSNVDDPATGTATITGTFAEGETLSANTSSISDVDGTITFTYQWQVSDNNTTWTNINGATTTSYTIPSDQSLVDKYIRVTAVTTDSRGGTTNFISQSSQVSNVNDQPTGQLTISGIVTESLTISADTTNITDEDGVLTYTYQWELSNDNSIWVNITGETNQSYTIPKDQGYVGKYVRVTAQSTDPYSNQQSHTSASSEILVFIDPPNDIQLSGTEVYEAYEIGQEIGTLTSFDVDSTSFTYEVDSNLFSINNNKLFSNHVFSYGSTNTYTINITTTDETLNSFTKAFVITVKRLWVYTTLSSTEVAIGNNTTDLANGTVLGTSLSGSIIIPSTIEDINGNTYNITNIYQNAFTGSSLEKITFSGDTTYTLDIPLKQVFQIIQTEEEYVLHQLNEV